MPTKRKQKPGDIPTDPEKFTEAVRAFRRRVPVTSKEWERLTEAEREWAFRVANVAQAGIVQDVFDAIDSAILNGETFETFKEAAADKLARAWGAPDAARFNTVFRTNVQRAYNEGRQQVLDAPPVRKARPFLRFDAIGDNRTSDICNERDGITLPADDPFWKQNTPPLHHRCRSVLVPLSEEDVQDEPGRRPSEKMLSPGEGFGAPLDASQGFDVDLERFDPAIRKTLAQRLKKAAGDE